MSFEDELFETSSPDLLALLVECGNEEAFLGWSAALL
jgi:hypothetical protein